MIYVIDHKDSFTHNVVHQFALFDSVECDLYSEINEKKLRQASTIVFSPGPGNPKNYPITSKIYKKFKGKKKLIGICLGFQQILFCEGAKIIEQKKVNVGKSSTTESRYQVALPSRVTSTILYELFPTPIRKSSTRDG